MADIKFYIPKNITIPTDLRLVVDDIGVYYKRISGGFEFKIYVDNDAEALEIADKIITAIKNEHDEPQHGISWRTLSVEIIPCEWDFQRVVVWKYYVRDSY